jgi:O-antigen ligase
MLTSKFHKWQAGLPTGSGQVIGFVVLVLLSVFVAAASGYYFIAGFPALVIIGYLALVNFKPLYWLLIATIPLSTEIYLPNGLGTDLPTEPLMVGLMLVFVLFALQRLPRASFDILQHPLSLILLLHMAWLGLTTLTSGLMLVSFKFLLAKTWYVVTFFGITAYLIRKPADFKQFFWVFFWPFMLMVSVIFLRHAMLGFSFQGIHSIMHPFQRNHVNYAASLSLFYPFIILMMGYYVKGSWQRKVLWGAAILVIAAIYFSYTRAAYVALLIALGVYYIVRWRLMRYTLIGLVIATLIGVFQFVNNNKYLEYAPNYDRTISHENFDNLIEATYKMEDISTMERLYRWVAARHMTPERPLLGWGPGNFTNFYKSFTVTSFQTYVSDNPEQSGIHSYFLMTLVEQGFPGLIIFTALLFVFFMRGEKTYHALAAYPDRQRIVLMVLLSTAVICAFLLINDLIETDKVGSFFFINIAILINQEHFLLLEKRKLNKKIYN